MLNIISFEENEIEKQLEEEIIKNSIALGLNPFSTSNIYNDSLYIVTSDSSLSATTTSTTSTTKAINYIKSTTAILNTTTNTTPESDNDNETGKT
jgi:hypothetical protein